MTGGEQRRKFLEIPARIVLGGIFLVAGLLKLHAFSGFAETVARTLGIPSGFAVYVGVSVIVAELVVGLLLVSGYKVRKAAWGALLMLMLFIILLWRHVGQPSGDSCFCFGAVGPRLPARWQLVLDFALFDLGVLLLCVVQVRPDIDARPCGFLRHRVLAGSAVCVTSFLSLMLLTRPDSIERTEVSLHESGQAVASFLAGNGATPGRREIVLLVNLGDFACITCLDDFLAFCDSVERYLPHGGLSVRMIVKRDPARPYERQARLLRGWARGNGFTFPVLPDGEGLYERSGISKTSLFQFSKDGELINAASFPLGPATRSALLEAIVR
jgi:uncharacterized membrane protein YphA (DoxX/SURF4 family)